MSVRHYSREQLLKLRESPLVKKPEDLPAIEQWLEYLYLDKDSREKLRIPHSESSSQPQPQAQQPQPQKDPNTKDAKSRVTRPSNTGDASPMGNFSTGQRPSLMQTRSAKTSDDVVLGPPKTAFSSSSRFARANPTGETTAGSEDTEGTRPRTFGDRQQTRNNKGAGEKEGGRDWTALRQPRTQGDADEQSNDRLGKYGRRDRDHDGERRNGDKQDSRWGQREDKGQREERRQNGERQGGWRDRESNRQNRGWDREQAEKEPEWFDEPMKKQEEDLGMGTAHTQADFQKWKEMMKKNKEPAEEPATSAPAPAPAPPAQATPSKPSAPMKLEGFSEPMFGGFGAKPAAESPAEGVPATSKAPPPSKGKSSRFASVFKKEETPPAPVQEAPVQQQQPILEPGMGLNEDKAGFQRILQMLGGANIGSPSELPGSGGPSEPASPQVRGPSGATKQKSRFFDSAPKSPGEVNSPQSRFQSPRAQTGSGPPPGTRGMADDPNGFFGLPMPQKAPQESSALPFPPSNVVSPEPTQPSNGNRDSYPPQQRPNEHAGPASRGPPSRGPATPDVGIQNLLAAQRAQRPQAANKDSEFLLGLLQGQGGRPASQQQQQGRPHQDFNLWVGQPPEPHAPKPRAPPPPGLIDDQLLRNAPPEMSRHEPPPMPGQDLGRRSSQRAPAGPPPGFDEHAMFIQQQMQQRRNFEGPQQPQQQPPPQNRRMGPQPGMPGMPPQQQPGPQFPPDFPFMQSPPIPHQGPPQGGPPPGFAPNMRHPQGFANVPNIFQAQQQREPPGFGGMMQNPMSPPVPPPGFGGPIPPGLMGMRSPPEGVPNGNGFRGAGRGYEGFDQRR